jgi:hypothetical protein
MTGDTDVPDEPPTGPPMPPAAPPMPPAEPPAPTASRMPPAGPGASPADRSAPEREAARLRWELSRLHSRRSVRAALLATEAAGARAGGAGDVLATLRGRRIVEDLDVIAPASARPRFAYPHLDVVHIAADPVFGAAAPHRRIAPDGARSTLDGARPTSAGAGPAAQSPDTIRLQPPDLVVLDDLAGLARWSERGRRQLRDALPSAGAVLGLVTSAADAAEAATWPLDLLLLGPGMDQLDAVVQLSDVVPCLPLLPGVDPRADGPVGWRRRPDRAAVMVGEAGSAVAAALASDLGVPLATSADAAADAGAAIVAEPTGWTGTRRVLALLARGIPVVVTEDAGVPDELAGLVDAVRPEQLLARATGWDEDLDVRERRSVQLRRIVLREHTHRARLESVLAQLGVPRRRPERISVLLATRRPGQLEDAVAQVAGQDHPDVELVAALHGDGFDDDAETRLAALHPGPTRVVRVDGAAPLGDVLNAALDEATGTLIAKMDDDDLYGTGHLSDLVVALDYSGADVVGRWSNETHLVDADVTLAQDLDRQERWAHHLPGATMLVRGDVLRAVRFRRVPRHVDTHLLRSIHAAGGAAYATHRFGFIRRRHGDHTYDPGDARFDVTAPGDGAEPERDDTHSAHPTVVQGDTARDDTAGDGASRDRATRPRPGLDRSVLEV